MHIFITYDFNSSMTSVQYCSNGAWYIIFNNSYAIRFDDSGVHKLYGGLR